MTSTRSCSPTPPAAIPPAPPPTPTTTTTKLLTTTVGYGTPQAAATTLTYDANENIATSTDPNGTKTAFTYTPRDKLWTTSVKQFIDDPVNPGTPRNVVTESRAYDSQGRLASVTDALGHETDYQYWDDGLLESTTRVGVRTPDPATGNLGPATSDVVTASYYYDGAGNKVAGLRR